MAGIPTRVEPCSCWVYGSEGSNSIAGRSSYACRPWVRLVLEAVRADRGNKLGVENLKGHPTVILDAVGKVDRGHAAAPKLTLEEVAIAKGVG